MESSPYSLQELEEFKKILLLKKGKSTTQLEEFSSLLDEMNENGKDEKGLGNSNQDIQTDQIILYIHRCKKHLNDIENALLRIKNNTYGICTITGKKIDEKRLLAVPTTTKSIEAKMNRT